MSIISIISILPYLYFKVSIPNLNVKFRAFFFKLHSFYIIFVPIVSSKDPIMQVHYKVIQVNATVMTDKKFGP